MVPARTAGRITDIAIDPRNNAKWVVATASGGVWKTTNRGTTWKPVFDTYGSYSIGVVTMDPRNPDIVWLGTGENNSQRSVGYGDGVYKSLDGGETWSNMGLETSEHIGKIVIDPRNSDRVYVAAQGPLWRSGGERGFYLTEDGGATWTRTLHISEETGISDIVQDWQDPDILYAATYQRRRHFGILIAGGPEGGIYKSTDAGKTWKKSNRGLPGGDLGRIGMAISPQKANVLYAVVAAGNDRGGFYRSENKGETWKRMSDYMVVDAQYYMELFPDPNQFDRVYSVDMRLHVTHDGGKSFERVPENRKHVDNHELEFDPEHPEFLLVGCDGGIYESWDRGKTWRLLPNLPITQFYRVGIDNAKPFYNIYGGTQDNATLGGPSRTIDSKGIKNSDWYTTVGGDGFQTRVDPTNPDIIYSMYQYAGIVRYDRKSGQRIDIQPQTKKGEEPLRWNWDAPLIISPHNPSRLYFAANKLYRSDDRGDNWTLVSGDLTKNLNRNEMEVMGKVWSTDAVFKNVFTSPLSSIVALAESEIKEGLLIVGTDDGLVQVSEDGGTNWRRTAHPAGVPQMAYVSDVFADKFDASTLYVVYNYHKYGDFKPYIFKSTDLGSSWKSIRGNLPEEFLWTVYQDHLKSDLLFAGSEFGCYVTLDGGLSWHRLRNGMPTIPIRDLEISTSGDDLVAASFGRGFFILDDYSPLRELKAELFSKNALLPVRDAWSYTLRNQEGNSMGHSFFSSPNPEFGAIITYHIATAAQSLKSRRKQQEANGVAVTDFEQLRKEDRETPPRMVLRITNSNGDLMQTVKANSSKGLHRTAWNLRATTPEGGMGPLVPPGTYRVELVQITADGWERFGMQSFEVRALGNATLPAPDPVANFAIQQEVMDATRLLRSTEDRLESIEKEVTKQLATSINEEQHQQLLTIKTEILEARALIYGDETRSSRAEFVSPGARGRIQRVRGSFWGTTSQMTGTQQESFRLGLEMLNEALEIIERNEQRLSN